MQGQEADDIEFQTLRMRHKADIEASGMTRDELIDLLARNLASYNLLCKSYESNCRQLEGVIKVRTQLCNLLERQSAEDKRKLLATVNTLPKVIQESMKFGGKEFAAKAGRGGATKRHAATRELKDWALQEASQMRGTDKGIAQKLVMRLPAHLVEASQHPERLIYDTLRAAKRPPAQKAERGFKPNTRSR